MSDEEKSPASTDPAAAPAAGATPSGAGGATFAPPAPTPSVAPPKAAAPARKPRKPRPKAIINENGCTGCEACITVCPVDCIVKIPNPALPELNPICRVDWDRCTGCTICARDCPWETIDMVYPTQPGIRATVESYLLTEYGDQFVPDPQEEEAVA
jgi:Pyruvate/2-oxoacid:ferredoxin oxidoreductase delta subunit